MVTMHVDDMAAAANNMMTLQHTMKTLWTIIDLINMGPIKWFLGMHVSRDHKAWTISLSQSAYIDTVLERFGMTDAYGVSTLLTQMSFCPQTCAHPLKKRKVKCVISPTLLLLGPSCMRQWPHAQISPMQQTNLVSSIPTQAFLTGLLYNESYAI